MISEHVWDYDFDTETNVIDVYVNYLRKEDRLRPRAKVASHGPGRWLYAEGGLKHYVLQGSRGLGSSLTLPPLEKGD